MRKLIVIGPSGEEVVRAMAQIQRAASVSIKDLEKINQGLKETAVTSQEAMKNLSLEIRKLNVETFIDIELKINKSGVNPAVRKYKSKFKK